MSKRDSSGYYDTSAVATAVARGAHRELIGGLWDEIGLLQFEFLKAQGLHPADKLLDIGCGCLRGGVHFVKYLQPGHYFGIDLNQALLDVGYDFELVRLGLTDRLPRSNLLCDAEFNFNSFGQIFDCALALSLFTHLPLNIIRSCLERLAAVVRRGGTLYATFFEVPENHPTGLPMDRGVDGIVTYGDADPYHFRLSNIRLASAGLPWATRYVGNFNHPRHQMMLAFDRTSN